MNIYRQNKAVIERKKYDELYEFKYSLENLCYEYGEKYDFADKLNDILMEINFMIGSLDLKIIDELYEFEQYN